MEILSPVTAIPYDIRCIKRWHESASWNQSNFKHALVGLRLDEVHSQLECIDCHPGRNFSQTPNCSTCYEDGCTFLTSPPGELIQ